MAVADGAGARDEHDAARPAEGPVQGGLLVAGEGDRAVVAACLQGILQVDPGGRVADARRADAQHAAGIQPARQRGHIAQQVGHGGLALTRHGAIGVERTGGKGLRRGAILIQNAAKGLGAAAVPPGVILCLHTFAPLLFSYYVYTQIFS